VILTGELYRRKHKRPRQILVMSVALKRAVICAFVNLIIFGMSQSVGRSRISILVIHNSRKVRAPVDRLPDNSWAQAVRTAGDGKCHREQTAISWQG
jgi:hypothetical protein